MDPDIIPLLFSFVFRPSDKEIIQFYLTKKLMGTPMNLKIPIQDLNVYLFEPEDLPITFEGNKKRLMHFFVYMTEENAEHSTPKGYWKLVGSDKPIRDPNTSEIIGLKNSFVYYTRQQLGGPNKTNWTMKEFRKTTDAENLEDPNMKKNWVLCKIETVIPEEEPKTKSKKRKRRRRAHNKQGERKGDISGKTESTADEAGTTVQGNHHTSSP